MDKRAHVQERTTKRFPAAAAIQAWVEAERRASVEKRRLLAACRERVAAIRAEADRYCANVDERIATDNNRTEASVASLHRDIALAGMVATVVRSRCDEMISRSRERSGLYGEITEQLRQCRGALAGRGLLQHEREMLLGQIASLQQSQARLQDEAVRDSARLPPLVVPGGTVPRAHLSGGGVS
jgi:hypothetical protein